MSPYRKAMENLPTQYIKNWFGANSFFNTIYTSTNMLHDDYFITCDRFITTDCWTLRYINKAKGTIDTIQPAPLDSKEECKVLLTKTLLSR